MSSVEGFYLLEEMPWVSINKAGSVCSNSSCVATADVCTKRAGSILFDELDLAIADNKHCKRSVGWTKRRARTE